MLLWISGQSGAGKTTLGHNLSTKHNYTHYDGDTYFSGGDPITQAGKFIGREGASDELKQQWSIIEKNYTLLFQGTTVPVSEWIPALEGMCKSIATKSKLHDNLVVTFSLYTHEVRNYVSECIKQSCSKNVQFVILNDVDGAAAKRKLNQVKAAAEKQNMTMDEFVGQYGKEWKGDEETLKELNVSQRGFEPAVESDGEIGIDMRDVDDAEIVFGYVLKALENISS